MFGPSKTYNKLSPKSYVMSNRPLFIYFGKNLILISVVAGAYFLFGLLGLLFKYPSDPIAIPSSMIMPSAGLALVAALMLGIWALPAIAIGNLLVSAWSFNFNQEYLYFYIASAASSMLSAWIGRITIRRLIGFPDPLVEGKKILLFFFLAGSLGCLPSAVISVTALNILGIVTLKDLPFAYLGWWCADILGVLIFSPLTLIMFAEPHHIWYRRRTTVGLPIMLTFAMAVMLSFYLKDIIRTQYTGRLKERAFTLSQELKNRIQLELSALHALRIFLLGSQSVGPNEFSLLVKETLSPFKEVQSVNWLNTSETDGEKSQFIPIHGQLSNNKPESLQAIPSSLGRLKKRPPVFKPEFLVPEQNNFELFIPVVKERNDDKKMMGMVSASVSLESIVQEALEAMGTGRYGMTISVSNNGMTNAKKIYTNFGGSSFPPYETIPISVADQVWLISFYHDWAEETLDVSWPIYSIIFSGFWFSGVLGVFLLYLTGRNFLTEAIIDERTKVLTETKTAAEQANQAKNQFLAKISHELRTPLNGISGFTQLLEKKPTLNAEDKKQVAIIKQCSDDLLRLINDILDISAIETSQIKLEIGEFDFTPLITDSIRLCQFRADEKGLQLFSENISPPDKYLGDEKRIRQILVNLIDNAVKYTNQGSVTVTTSYGAGIMKISVADTGSGIEQKDLDRIFVPFVQVNADSFTREGVGLGLPITKELVHLMGGDLNVSSEIGKGSTFTVLLPLPLNESNQVQDSPTEVLNETDSNHGTHVIVVDDSEINVLFLVSMLEQLSCKVDSAKDGQEALALFEKNRYDFALIDINMPVINGIELVKRLRRQNLKLKLVAVSAYADEGKISEALSAGFDAYITKPIKEYQLVELIQETKI